MLLEPVKNERGSIAVPILYIMICLLSLQVVIFTISRYWLHTLQEDIQTKLDMSSMACYPVLSIENLAELASITIEENRAKGIFTTVLAKQLELDEHTWQPKASSPIQQLKIDKFKIYQASEVPVTLTDGRIILHSPAIESQITVYARIPFIGRSFPFKFHSVTDLPQTP